ERARGEAFLDRIRALDPEVSVVVAYGQILTREVLEAPPLGSINVHASLLPELRGAAPINWAIIRGHTETGVTVMRMVEQMDAGPILVQHREPIGPDERASDLAVRLSELGAAALVEALALLEAGLLEAVEQDHSRATYAPRLLREHARIDWSLDAEAVARWIRGLDEVPGGWTTWGGEEVKVYRPLPEPGHVHDAAPGAWGPGPGGRASGGGGAGGGPGPGGSSRGGAAGCGRWGGWGAGPRTGRPVRVMLPRLHLITDDAVLASPGFLDGARWVLREQGAGVALHLRGHGTSAGILYELARALVAEARETGGWVLVNDRVDVALAVGAAGVQLGRRSIPVRAARDVLGAGARIGYSAHDPDEA